MQEVISSHTPLTEVPAMSAQVDNFLNNELFTGLSIPDQVEADIEGIFHMQVNVICGISVISLPFIQGVERGCYKTLLQLLGMIFSTDVSFVCVLEWKSDRPQMGCHV
jgi:hypothetical protein